MKTLNEIFSKKLLCATAVVCALALPAYAANNGCDNEANDRINPEIALCSTHVYNIGGDQNPNSDAQREIMKDVVALKTTIMTQQMYKQYEYLETMIRRFKTQLEKAVLTTKLQAAGADTTESSSGGSPSFKSNDSNIRLAGAQNCMTTTSFQNAYSCLTSNIQLVLNAVNGGNNIGEAKRQLSSDLKVAVTWGAICGTENKYGTVNDKDGSCNEGTLNYCNSMSNNRNSIIQCAQQFNVAIARSAESKQQKQNMQNRYNYVFGG